MFASFQTFIEYKCKCKNKARCFKSGLLKTGGGKSEVKDLTEIEEKVMSIVRWVSAEGDPDLQEACTIAQSNSLSDNNNFEQLALLTNVEPEEIFCCKYYFSIIKNYNR